MKKALVIEDNEDNLRLITYALKRYEYDIVSAETGEEGIEMAINMAANPPKQCAGVPEIEFEKHDKRPEWRSECHGHPNT